MNVLLFIQNMLGIMQDVFVIVFVFQEQCFGLGFDINVKGQGQF